MGTGENVTARQCHLHNKNEIEYSPGESEGRELGTWGHKLDTVAEQQHKPGAQ